MKKVVLFIFVLFLSFLFVACKDSAEDPKENEKEETYNISFYNGEELLQEITYNPKTSDKLSYPVISVEEGYYFSWNKEIPDVIDSDIIFICEIKEIEKQYTFIIDGEVIKVENIKYHEEIENPEYEAEEGVKSFSWDEEYEGEDNHILKYVITLNKVYYTYTVKFTDYKGNVL
ncbi:MAG: hypothetical protein J5666_00055, partial [Bacilli bacterium]|nr:hypothetical protein [Bacilli bacterium]